MSYFGLIPEDAHGREHLTLMYCGERVLLEAPGVADILTEVMCPVKGIVYGHQIWNGKRVALIHVPHKLHVRRHSELASYYYKNSFDLGWNPHISEKEHKRALGEVIMFDRVEFRQKN